MILKKPYAFLIKYFKIIHLIIGSLLCFILYRYYEIYDFFKDYVNNNYKTAVIIDLEKTYTPFFLYLTLLIIISLIIGIIILLRKKNKPLKLYLLMTVYYIIFLVGLIYLSFVFMSFENALLSSTVARSIRDILLILLLPQLVFIFYSFIRAIGFNIKGFNFENDIKELSEFNDNEEVEITINFDATNIKKKTHRTYRELIYYAKENKFILSIVGGIVVIISLYFIATSSHKNYNQSFTMGGNFTYNKLSIKINEAIDTNLNFRGDIIEPGYSFIVLNAEIQNNSGKSVNMDYNNFKLSIGNKTYTPENLYAHNFIDFGAKDVPTSIAHRTTRQILIVYKVSDKDVNKSKRMEIFNGTVYDKGESIPKYIYVKIKTKSYYNVSLENTYYLENEVIFDKTFLKNTTLVVNSYQIMNQFLYNFEECQEEKCVSYKDIITIPVAGTRSKNTLLILNAIFNEDMSSNYAISYSSVQGFANNFIKIKYKIDDEIKTTEVIDVTPKNLNNSIVLEVPSEINKATVIELIVTIRNKEYIIYLLG